MKTFTKPSQRILTTLAVIVTLLLQVQTVFACDMMGTGGDVDHCCCDDMKPSSGDDLDIESECCEFSNELSVKDNAINEEPVLIQAYSNGDLPQTDILVVMASLWTKPPVDATTAQNIFYDQFNKPVNAGTHTYLETQRLRI